MFEEEKYCGKCGAKKSQSFKYCLHCGAKYDEKSVQETNNSKEQEKTLVQESVHYAVKQEPKKVVEKPPVQKYCPKCGMEIIPEDKFCIECGLKKSVVYIPKVEEDDFSDKEEVVKTSTNPIWTLLFILSILNMVVVGMPAGLATVIGIFVLLFDFGSGISIVLVAGSILALSILAIKYFSNKTSTKRG